MTIASQISKAAYAGNGSTQAFPVPFYFLSDDDIVVVLRASDGTETEQTITTHYALTGSGEQAGGACTMVTAPAVGETLVIYRDPAIVQETDYVENDAFPAETHERALDLLTMIAQRTREQLGRAPLLAEGTAVTAGSLVVPEPEANAVLAWNSDGDNLVNGPNADEIENAQSYAEAAAASAASAAAQLALVEAEGATQIGLVEDQGDTQVARVQSEGTTQVGLCEAQVTLAEAQADASATSAAAALVSEGNASDSADIAAEWAENPEDVAVTGHPGEYSALHWAAKAHGAAGGGLLKVSAADTTAGYLEGKLLAGDGLSASTQNGGGNETRTLAVGLTASGGLELAGTPKTLGIDLDSNPGLQLGSGGLSVKLPSSTPGLARDADGLDVKLKSSGGLAKDSDGLYAATGETAGKLCAGDDTRLLGRKQFAAYTTARYFCSEITNPTGSGAASATADKLYAVPFIVSETTTFTRIGINVTAAASAGKLARLGIYSSLTTFLPGTRVLDAGTVSIASTGLKEITISQQLTPGLYWLALLVNEAVTVSGAGAPVAYFMILCVSTPGAASTDFVPYRDFSYAALPDPFGTLTGYTNLASCGPQIWMRVA